MAGRNPSRLLGLEEIRLSRGSRADLFLFRLSARDSLNVEATIGSGTLQFGTVPSP